MNNPLADHPGFLLRGAARYWTTLLSRRLLPLNLSVTEASILMVIHHNPGISQVAIGRFLNVQRANMAPLVHSLLQHGWIHAFKVDGRTQGLGVTDEGKRLVGHIETVFGDHRRDILSAVPEDMRAFVIPLLSAMVTHEEILNQVS